MAIKLNIFGDNLILKLSAELSTRFSIGRIITSQKGSLDKLLKRAKVWRYCGGYDASSLEIAVLLIGSYHIYRHRRKKKRKFMKLKIQLKSLLQILRETHCGIVCIKVPALRSNNESTYKEKRRKFNKLLKSLIDGLHEVLVDTGGAKVRKSYEKSRKNQSNFNLFWFEPNQIEFLTRLCSAVADIQKRCIAIRSSEEASQTQISTGRTTPIFTIEDIHRLNQPLPDDVRVAEMDLCKSPSPDRRSPSPKNFSPSNPAECLKTFRQMEYTDYGLSLRNKREPSDLSAECISVASYNVLSQTLLETHRYLYKQCHPKDLNWSARSQRLLDEFQLLNADILCLQEVEAAHIDNFFAPTLENLGYTGVYKQRTGDKIDGCAIYYKTDKFDVLAVNNVEFFKSHIRLLDRDNIGLVVKLCLREHPHRRFVVATTHLLYNPRRTDIKLTQTQIMLAEIERASYRSQGRYYPVIFTGDMNYTPDSVVYQLVHGGYLKYEGRSERKLTYSPDRCLLRKRLLPRSVGVTDTCQFADELSMRNESSPVLFESGALGHPLGFASVYNHVKGGLSEATTFQDRWQTVDYIFYSHKRAKSGSDDLELSLVSRLGLPDSSQADSGLRRLPSQSCGSDHLPLLATFHLMVS